MPNQPLSSRLSLAQAVVSANSRSKAVSIGLEKGASAEEEGWGQGQPRAKIMGREITVLKRWGYDWREDAAASEQREGVKQEDDERARGETSAVDASTQSTLKEETREDEPALWGLDLEAMRSSHGSVSSAHGQSTSSGLPIHTAQSARAYLIKSFASAEPPESANSPPKKKKTAVAIAAEKEDNLAMLLKALDLLYASWAHVLSTQELDRRAWAWYVHVRPEVQSGVAGWGGKGELKLAEILGLRRKG